MPGDKKGGAEGEEARELACCRALGEGAKDEEGLYDRHREHSLLA